MQWLRERAVFLLRRLELPDLQRACSDDGHRRVDEIIEDNPDGTLSATHWDVAPRYFHPHLKLFALPSKCPQGVRNALEESFKLFFASPPAALNNVRASFEELLTSLKVKRFEKKGQRLRFISLHRRIELLPTKYAEQAKLLLAIKWRQRRKSWRWRTANRDQP